MTGVTFIATSCTTKQESLLEGGRKLALFSLVEISAQQAHTFG